MKYFYPAIGLLVLAGVGYASYSYGINKGLVPANNTVVNNTVKNNSVVSNTNIPVLNDGNPNANVEAKTLAITSPKNGEIVSLDDVLFSNGQMKVTGTVSPNAVSVRIKMYATGFQTCLGGAEEGCPENPQPVERLVDDFKLTKFKTGDTTWSYLVASAFGNAPQHGETSGRFVVVATYTDGNSKTAAVSVTYATTVAEMGKPVIYLYPTTKQLVSVNVKPTSGISYSEPAIGNGWEVTASPDGTLVDSLDKTWPYLFWEGYATDFVTPKEGFVVARDEVSKFFDDKLTTLGLNAKEIADFKEFWMPRLQDKPYYFVTFVPQATFDAYAPLTVTPTPDTVIRVFFDYKGLDKPTTVPTQILPQTPVRDGFTVVEWGGRLYR